MEMNDSGLCIREYLLNDVYVTNVEDSLQAQYCVLEQGAFFST